MEKNQDSYGQIEDDAQVLRDLVGEMGRAQRSEIAERERLRKIEETKVRMKNIYSMLFELNKKKARETISIGETELELLPFNGEMHVYIKKGNGNNKVIEHEFAILPDPNLEEYQIHYREKEAWRTGQNDKTSAILAEEAAFLVPELSEIENTLNRFKETLNISKQDEKAA